MKAVYLEKPGSPLKVMERADPKLRPGAAVVNILAAPVLSFMRKVVSGELAYAMATPWIPGANGVGVVEEIAEDVVGLKRGDQVFIDPHIYTHTTTDTYDGILLGLTALSPNSTALQQRWRDGTFAQKCLLPAECLTVLPQTSFEPVRLSWLSFAAIAYGGLLRGELRPGQTLVVSGATGNIGACAVLIGLALGARRVVALGREAAILEQLKSIHPGRIETVELRGDLEQDRRAVASVAAGADLVYDMLGNVPTFAPTAAAIYALRHGGTAILMGGVQANLDLPYSHIMLNEISIRGSLMYPRSAPAELMNMVVAGLLPLSKVQIRTFPLEQVDAALEHAERGHGLSYSVLTTT
jgi:alcohol dehydrogenase